MVKPNCLSRALDQWSEDKSMRLYYNSNHVISIEADYEKMIIVDSEEIQKTLTYLPLAHFGTFHFITSFDLDRKHLKLLGEYFNHVSENVKII